MVEKEEVKNKKKEELALMKLIFFYNIIRFFFGSFICNF